MTNRYDIIINFLVDQAAKGNTIRAIDDVQKAVKDMKAGIGDMRSISERLGQTSRAAFAGGTVIVGGIIAAANNYVKNAKLATEVTLKWQAAQTSLERSGKRVGAVLAQEALPLLEKAATLADKAAGFIEKHPEIVQAALNTGVVLAGLGAIGMAVSKGIRLYADILYLATIAQEQAGINQFSAAVDRFLLGTSELSGMSAIGRAAGPIGAAGALSTAGKAIGTVTLLATSVIIGANLGLALGNALAKLFDPNSQDSTMKDIGTSFKQTLAIAAKGLGDLTTTLNDREKQRNKGLEWFEKVARALGLRGDGGNGQTTPPVTGVAASPAFDQVLKAYEDYKSADLALVQKHYTDREQIISDSLKAEQNEMAQYAASVQRITSQRSSALATAARDYEKSNVEAEQRYQSSRADIIRDGNKSVEQIQQASQDRLRRLAQEHNDRSDELTSARDALGLAQERRRYLREVAEERNQTGQEIKQRRQDIAQRLADLAESYAQERAQRQADYFERVKEIRANATEQLRELATQHAAELKQIREQKIAKIRELDSQFIEERKRRYQYFIQQIRDLDATLLGERNLRLQRQKEMIADVDRFLLQYKSRLASLSTASPSGRSAGGYASYGTYTLGDSPTGGRGKREYILSGNTTEALERTLGGSLTQEKLVSAIMNAGGTNSKSVSYTDNRRIDSKIGVADRNRIRDDAVQATLGVLNALS